MLIAMRLAKQVIVMRKDLRMRKGKMIAQGAHASLAVLLARQIPGPPGSEPESERSPQGASPGDGESRTADEDPITLSLTPAMAAWVGGRFTKICVYVQSEAELDEVYQRARDAGLSAALIVDAGHTEFAGVPTKTCCAIGPDWTDEVDAITGELPLL